ncbi:MAG: hypothetical protein ACLP9S_19660 [Syntrophales bacterium]|jgi:hypothetical protein
MQSKLDEIKIIKFFESRIGKLKNSPNRELLLDLQELFETLESGLSDETRDYLDKMIKNALQK